MKKTLPSIVAVAILVLALATNPTVEKHRDAVKENVEAKVSNNLGNDDNLLKRTFKAASDIITPTVLNNSINRKNYFLFSITTLKLGGSTSTIGVGLFGMVFVNKEAFDKIKQKTK